MNINDLEVAAVRLRALADAADARLRVIKLIAPVMMKVENNFARALAAVTINDDDIAVAASVAVKKTAIGF
jgi:hypothetical protein